MPATGEVTVFVYDAAGKLVAEYSTIVETANPQISHLTNDHLGSPRINTHASGNITARQDYHPFGEETTGTGSRTQGLGYTADDVRKQFTGYERDNEIDLDFAQARYYSNAVGRFTTSDEPLLDQLPEIPQSWNLYLYTRNNPLAFLDPTGESVISAGNNCPPVCLEIVLPTENVEIRADTSNTQNNGNGEFEMMARRPGVRRSFFDRAFRNLGEWLRHWFGRSNSPSSRPPTQSPSQSRSAIPSTQNREVYGPPSPPKTNVRANLPSAAQRLPSMDSLSSQTAANMLKSAGFSHRSTTSGGNQRWKHPDGSVVWINSNGTVDRVPGRNATHQSGRTGKGWRVDSTTGNITRPHQCF